MVNRCSKSLHFGRKSWGEFEKPTPEVPILGVVWHLDSISGLFQQTLNRCSKFLHFGRKSWGEFEKPTPEVPILDTVCHLDSICGVFQQTLNI